MTRTFLESKGLPKETVEAILEAHTQAVRQVQLSGMVDTAIVRARGRNPKAITALLDLQALLQSEEPESAVEQALESLQKECAYLFDQPGTPPPYAADTGTRGAEPSTPVSLADALRERFEGRHKNGNS